MKINMEVKYAGSLFFKDPATTMIGTTLLDLEMCAETQCAIHDAGTKYLMKILMLIRDSV